MKTAHDLVMAAKARIQEISVAEADLVLPQQLRWLACRRTWYVPPANASCCPMLPLRLGLL